MRVENLRVSEYDEDKSESTSLPDMEKVKKLIADRDRMRLKSVIRKCCWPTNHAVRDVLWKELAKVAGTKKVFLEEDRIKTRKLPPFVEPDTARFYYLNDEGKRQVSRVLWAIFNDHPDILSAPMIYPLCSLFIHFLSPEDTYQSLCNLLSSRELHFFGTTKNDKSRDAYVLIKLTNKFGIIPPRNFGAHVRNKLSQDSTIDFAFAEYLQWIYVFLPFSYCVRITDCFLVEGEKFLFRVALALALLFEEQNPQASLTLNEMRKFCEKIQEFAPTPQHLINAAVRLTRISKNKISRARAKADSIVLKSEDIQISPLKSPPKPNDVLDDVVVTRRIAPRRFRSSIVSWSKLDILWEWLPERCIVQEPLVVFFSDEHGSSLNTFYANCNDYEPTILIIKTIENEVFGAFCSSAWSQRHHHSGPHGYFGTGETFLFSLFPTVVKYEWVGKSREKFSHNEELFMCANSKMIGVGSGDGKWGLWLDENLTKGQSDNCPTFANKPLAKNINFTVAVVEVIAFC